MHAVAELINQAGIKLTCILLAVTLLPLVKAFNFSYGSSTPYLQKPNHVDLQSNLQ